MSHLKVYFYCLLLMLTITIPYAAFAANINIPILCYHNFNPTRPGSMNLTPSRVEDQIKYLKDNGYNIIPLREAVEYLQGKRDSLPDKAIVITVDDGWQSAYTYMLPLARKYNIPVTLFIYPQTISEGKNAMTWDELKQMKDSGLFDIQGHTYDHPNFKHAKKSMSPEKYAKFVQNELAHSKKELEDKMNIKVSYLAWPFGIYDAYLEDQAAKAGYDMAFTIDYLDANRTHRPMAQPRFMIVEGQTMKTFKGIVGGAVKKD